MKVNPSWLQRLRRGDLLGLGDLVRAIHQYKEANDGRDTQFDRFMKIQLPKMSSDPLENVKRPWSVSSNTLLEQHQRANWNGVDERLQLWAGLYMLTLRKMGVPMFAHNALRTPVEQKLLFERKVSQNPGPVAPHVRGYAVDIIHSTLGWDMSEDEWKYLGKIGKECARLLPPGPDIIWGGDWDNDGIPVGDDEDERFWDPAHWQVDKWRKLPHTPGHWASSPITKTPHNLASMRPRPQKVPP